MGQRLASLAAALAVTSLAACGGSGAEPDAPPAGVSGARIDLVLDFQPNAVHAGIYVAAERGLLGERGISLEIAQPGASTDAPRLLRSGRADVAILDINDLAIAREEGLEPVGIAALVQRPLAAVIAADRRRIREAADLEGRRIGVTGLPSDDAVLETVLAGGGLDLDDVETVTVGFDAVPALLAGRLDAATAFWNAEGVLLAERLPTRELRVDDLGAPAYPELVLATTPETLRERRAELAALIDGIDEGYRLARDDPRAAVEDLLATVPGLDRSEQRRQLDSLLGALGANRSLDRNAVRAWAGWARRHGIVDEELELDAAFDFSLAPR